MRITREYPNMTPERVLDVAIKHRGNLVKTARELGMKNRSTVFSWLERHNMLKQLREVVAKAPPSSQPPAPSQDVDQIKIDSSDDFTNITYLGEQIKTPEDLLKHANIDMGVYEIDSVTVNNWESAGAQSSGGIWKTGLRQIKIRLRRKKDEIVAVERLLARLEASAPIVGKLKYPRNKAQKFRRALEVSITDPHLGLMCFKGDSDHNWSLEECGKLCMWSVDSLLDRAKVFGDFDEIVFPFGNDFMHHDNLLHTTTRGTPQPDGIAFQYVFENAIKLATAMIDRLSQVAPVKVVQVSGNHDQVASFSLGHVLSAYYRNNKNISVNVSRSPYKFYRFGTNLIGYDHGHHIKPIRLAAIMAHECKEDWAKTTYREWHCGDQHRKGSGSPVIMEEQGVSVEYLPALTPPNAWHRQKGFNWQQRGAMAFVWDHDEGPIARLQVNLNSYTGKPTGV